jgi:hypothetical protein
MVEGAKFLDPGVVLWFLATELESFVNGIAGGRRPDGVVPDYRENPE